MLFHCDNQLVCDIWCKGSSRSPEVMALVRMLYFCAAKFDINVMIVHIAGSNNTIADALSHFQATCFHQLALLGSTSSRQHPCVADPVLDRLLHEYQSLGVALSTCRTYRAGVRSYQQFLQPIQHSAIPCYITYIALLLYLHCTTCILQDNQSLLGWDTSGTPGEGAP